MDSRLLVCPARWAGAVAEAAQPSHVVTFRSPGAEAARLGGACERLDLVFHDVAGPRDGLTPPDAGSIGRLLAFARAWPSDRPLLLTCYAGVSRSTAAAYLIACLKREPGGEHALARTLRGMAPSATPNPLIVALGDAALGRGGRMVEAIGAIGRGADAFEGAPFAWNLERGTGHRLALAASSTAASPACSIAPSTSPV